MQEELKEKIINNQIFRKELAISSYFWFFHIYFAKYIKYPTADFQREWCNLLEDWSIKFLVVIGFRNSAKTTYSMLGFPVWAVITQKSHYILLLGDTFNQIKEHIQNIKYELETNKLLIQDWGPFEENDLWTATDIIIPRYNAKITARSSGQKIRGARFRQWRPSLIIGDDLENIESVRTAEQRRKTYKWFNGEVIPSGQENARFILTGNLLNKDCLLANLEKEISSGQRQGIVKKYPIIKDGDILWKGKYFNMDAIRKERAKVGKTPEGERTWQREYLLNIVPEEGQIIKDDWIKYYDEIPNNVLMSATGVDLAISKKDSADYTAMVSGKLAIDNGEKHLYIMPNPTNERLSGFETTEKAKKVSLALGEGRSLTPLWVEDVAYQRMQIEAMHNTGLPVEGVKVSTDKRARLIAVSSYIQNGTVLFPRTGCEDLISQLLGFGIETHDDLVDAFTILVSKMMLGLVSGHLEGYSKDEEKTIMGNMLRKEF